jgi:hypothetical protein
MIAPMSPAPIRDRLETPLGEGLALVLEFPRVADRWGHRLSLVSPAGELVLFRSQEGDDQASWPESPPLQCLSIEQRRKDHSVALLLGMAGGSHWSASIEPDPPRRSLVFELACRVSARPEFLGSHYMLGPEVRPAGEAIAGETQAAFLAGPHRLKLTTEALPEGLTASISTTDNRIAVRYTHPFHDGRRTYRWMYRLSVE